MPGRGVGNTGSSSISGEATLRIVCRLPGLKWILDLAEANGRLARWSLRLLEFDFKVFYRKGAKNTIADGVCQILRVTNMFTTTYHPQTNGQVERFNRTLLAGLRAFVGEHPRRWHEFTSALVFAYNTQVHRSTGVAPFDLVLSRPPGPVTIKNESNLCDETPSEHARAQFVANMRRVVQQSRRVLMKAQAR